MEMTQQECKPTAAGLKTCSGRMFWLDRAMDDVTNSTVKQFSRNYFYDSYFYTNSSVLNHTICDNFSFGTETLRD
jgi:hypothetical protein